MPAYRVRIRTQCEVELVGVQAGSLEEVKGVVSVPFASLWRENINSLADIKVSETEVLAIEQE